VNRTENLAYEEEGKERREIIDGRIVMMSPRPAVNHNTVITNLTRLLGNYLTKKRCRVFSDGVDVHLDEKNILIPDVMIVCNRDIIKRDGIYGAPDLAVEVLSPSTATRDRREKKMLYEKFGVKEYWLIDAIGKSVEVYLLKNGKFTLDNVYSVYPDWQWAKMTDEEKAEATLSLRVSLYDDFVVDVQDIFENVE